MVQELPRQVHLAAMKYSPESCDLPDIVSLADELRSQFCMLGVRLSRAFETNSLTSSRVVDGLGTFPHKVASRQPVRCYRGCCLESLIKCVFCSVTPQHPETTPNAGKTLRQIIGKVTPGGGPKSASVDCSTIRRRQLTPRSLSLWRCRTASTCALRFPARGG